MSKTSVREEKEPKDTVLRRSKRKKLQAADFKSLLRHRLAGFESRMQRNLADGEFGDWFHEEEDGTNVDVGGHKKQ